MHALIIVLLSEFDTAGHTDALEIPLLLSSDLVTADVELDQRPLVTYSDISDNRDEEMLFYLHLMGSVLQ